MELSVDERNQITKKIYFELRNETLPNMVDLIKAKNVAITDINSDMALFKQESKGKKLTYYFNRIEVRNGSAIDVLPLNRT